MRVMIVGGAGYVGQRLGPYLISRGHEVQAWDAMLLDNPVPDYPLVWDDLFNIKSEHLAGYDRVIFLAGLSNDPMADFSPSKNFIQNTAAPLHVAYMAKQAGVRRFIYASSASVYGNTGGKLMTVEDTVAPDYPYGIAKLAGERAVLQLADSSFQVIAFRKGTVCGWSPRMRFDLAVNAMYKDAKTKGVVTVNAGQVHRPILAMSDCVEAYTRAVETDRKPCQAFNICSDNYSMSRVGDLVAYQTCTKLLLNFGDEKRDYQISADSAERVLDWKPTQGVIQIVEELEQHCSYWPPEQFEDDRWHNIRMMRKHA
jgi:nucleoside-diphosphate-sugar epimerase